MPSSKPSWATCPVFYSPRRYAALVSFPLSVPRPNFHKINSLRREWKDRSQIDQWSLGTWVLPTRHWHSNPGWRSNRALLKSVLRKAPRQWLAWYESWVTVVPNFVLVIVRTIYCSPKTWCETQNLRMQGRWGVDRWSWRDKWLLGLLLWLQGWPLQEGLCLFGIKVFWSIQRRWRVDDVEDFKLSLFLHNH